jgi:hypothetical protein
MRAVNVARESLCVVWLSIYWPGYLSADGDRIIGSAEWFQFGFPFTHSPLPQPSIPSSLIEGVGRLAFALMPICIKGV